MNLENVDIQLSELLEKIRPDLTPALTDRATAAIRAARPVPIHSRRRLIAITAGAAVAFFALGFVPIPLGRTKGALERAQAAMDGATGLFIWIRSNVESSGADDTDELREWLAPGGLKRVEASRQGKLISLGVFGRHEFVHYDARSKTALVGEYRHPEWAADHLFGAATDRFGVSRILAGYAADPAARTQEFRERSLWGGVRDVVEMERDNVKQCYELDPKTGRLLSRQVYSRKGNSWTLVSWTEDVAWDVDIPEDTWDFELPPGTKATVCNTWWSERSDQPVASGQTADWEFTLYTMDMDRKGNLYLALGWQPLTEDALIANASDLPTAAATDNLGVTYAHQPQVYRGIGVLIDLIKLNRERSPIPPGVANTCSITIHAGTFGLGAGQTLTFADLPLPPRQNKDDLLQMEEVQY